MAKKTLGRGLGAILGEVTQAYENEINLDENRILDIDIDAIRVNPHQPRKTFDEKNLKELASSIKKNGLLQPIVVTEDIDGFILIAGERRLRASKLAGLEKIKAIVIDIEPKKFREIALIENIQREDLNPIDLALSYKELIEDYNITHEELSNIVHKSRAHITNTLRLLHLSDYTKEAIKSGKISSGHAKVLVGLDKDKQKILVDSIIGQKLSVRDVEKLVKKEKNQENRNKKENKKDILDLSDVKKSLENTPLNFKIKNNKLIIEFKNSDEISYFLESFLSKNY
ncbi:ParB/RepB/Spo0J family partition protein [Nitrosophilus kaiyonis]|uniref:ParB/RepB/Spo0J family partition protein n=1 Tax=Nitrosophilus kaiyonis TaxID=2930200 RepID=UPI002491028F|nr:ParB/RepB/Spo0J family partition protein [Nitrosophilus kaiyonis]